MNNDDRSPTPGSALARRPRAEASADEDLHPVYQDPTEIALATAIVLLEIASCDHRINKFERSIIHAGLKNLFGISDESATAVMAEGTNHLRNMRGSSSEATLLKDALEPYTKRELALVIDKLISIDGEAESLELYLRKKFRTILGLPDVPYQPPPVEQE